MNDLKNFLQRDDIQQLLYEERLEEVYKKWDYGTAAVTRFFIENEINPLDYMDNVLPYMFVGLDLKHIVIPNGIKEIGDSAFGSCPFGSITIPDSVTSIGYWAFADCTSLTSITIPDSVTIIGDNAFCDCNNLVVTCKINSYTHNYCEENGIKYKAI